MPGKLKVCVVAARNLPVMDRATDLTDAFVEVKFANTTFKTDVYKKSLNPQWNSEWYRFEAEDEELQDFPLQLRVLDHDTYSAHDAIGKVYIDLNPLLLKDGTESISGWFPIYDTMHGIRGELNVVVKVELFTDLNKFRQSSCGVYFFATATVPSGYKLQAIQGFVEELVVNDDPEHQWIDRIRSQRASNEARQVQFSKLSGELQRKIGKKVLELGGTAVLGYKQCFDLEGVYGIVVRAIGTAVTLTRVLGGSSPRPYSPVREGIFGGTQMNHFFTSSPPHRTITHRASVCGPVTHHTRSSFSSHRTSVPEEGVLPDSPTNPSPTKPSSLQRRNSDSDLSNTPQKATSMAGSSGSGTSQVKPTLIKPVFPQNSLDMMEYPFFTMTSFPPGFIANIGGAVSARSVRLLDKINNPDESETRDAWWSEIRTEIRCHAKSLSCNAVLGYSEHTTICEEIIILSAIGTAANISLRNGVPDVDVFPFFEKQTRPMAPEGEEIDGKCKLHVDVNLANQAKFSPSTSLSAPPTASIEREPIPPSCDLCHAPYAESSHTAPPNMLLSTCNMCKYSKVPDVLFTTLEFPRELPIIGKGTLVRAHISRPKRDIKGESNAKEISEQLPFMEYELYKQLFNKVKLKGMNSVFGLKKMFIIGETSIVALAIATAVFASALPPAFPPKVVYKSDHPAGKKVEDRVIENLRAKVIDEFNSNCERYGLPQRANSQGSISLQQDDNSSMSEFFESWNDDIGVECSAGTKDTLILEVDQESELKDIKMLLEPILPKDVHISNISTVPGMDNFVTNLQFVTRVWRKDINMKDNSAFANIFNDLLKSQVFRLRHMTPCALVGLDFDIELADDDEIQVALTAMVIGEDENLDVSREGSNSVSGEELVFSMDDALDNKKGIKKTSSIGSKSSIASSIKKKYHIPRKNILITELTPLPYVPSSTLNQFLGHLNFFIIRESTSVRGEGGPSGFLHSFLSEILAICRAHVKAIGGNALVSFKLSECVLDDNLHRNQSQSLVNVSGDVASIHFEPSNCRSV